MYDGKLIFERGACGRYTDYLPDCDEALCEILGEENLRCTQAGLPECTEPEVVRHYTALSTLNFGVDSGFYPLGSCTMKYNPKIPDQAAERFADVHPLAAADNVQGCLRIMYETERYLSAICGMEAFSLQPAAGAHGELAGMMMLAAYHEHRGDSGRKVILIPDSAHGTNPASAAMAGFRVKQIPSTDGLVDLAALEAAMDDSVAGLMLTNPNTLGLFERDICRISGLVHDKGGLLYYDGANLNAILCKTSPGAMGFDLVHVNLHKTFATPHGGGGPGSGPVGASAALAPFLPVPRVLRDGDKYALSADAPLTIGRLRAFHGSFAVILKAYTYIRLLGAEGLDAVSDAAVYNANLLAEKLQNVMELPFALPCMHEFVLSAKKHRESFGAGAQEIAKGLIDKGYHPPTVYFPLIVPEAVMIEPTETETEETLDAFAAAFADIVRPENADSLHTAPHTTPVSRPDAVKAARTPVTVLEK